MVESAKTRNGDYLPSVGRFDFAPRWRVSGERHLSFLVGCGAATSAPAPEAPASPVVVTPLIVETPIDARCPKGFVNDLSSNCVPHEPAALIGMATIPSDEGYFYMDVVEVTASAYNACVAAKTCAPPGSEDDSARDYYRRGIMSRSQLEETQRGCTGTHRDRGAYPINCVRLRDARAYCAWVGKRLPTAAEWERAATGPTPRRFPWGDFLPGRKDICWSPGLEREVGPCLPGSHPLDTSPYGVKDMGGSLTEMVEDDPFPNCVACVWHPPNEKPSPPGPAIRGGTWIEPDDYSDIERKTMTNVDIVRFRGVHIPESGDSRRDWSEGFRCAK